VGKNKLARWNELGVFPNVIQPEIAAVAGSDHPVKGKWNNEIFRNDNPIVLELGCGKGEYTVGLAKQFPLKNFIGIDIKGARMWRGAKTSNDNKMDNVAFLRTRIEFITSFFCQDEVSEIWITFPDPHPGGRNFNKRLTSPGFLNRYRLIISEEAIVHLKTDNTELYNYTKIMAMHNGLEIIYSTNDLYSGLNPDTSVPDQKGIALFTHESYSSFHNDILSIRTHYEKLFLTKGMNINYISFRIGKEKPIEDAPGKTQN